MNTKNDFPWKETEAVRSAYEKDNYLICETGHQTGRAIIFCSSNGIYYPNHEEVFTAYIAKGDAGFEWYHLAQHERIRAYFEKIIFVRDIYKQWYVTGINARLNTADQVIDFLKKEVQGFKVYTCGSSAGGYAAALFGAQLQADGIFISSAQFFILPDPHYGPFVEEYASDPERSKYYDLAPFLKDRSNIYYNFPALCPEDNIQYDHIRALSGIRILQIKSAAHGKTFNGICWPYLLTMDHDKCIALHEKYSGRIVGNWAIRKDILPLGERILFPLRKMDKILKKVFRIQQGNG